MEALAGDLVSNENDEWVPALNDKLETFFNFFNEEEEEEQDDNEDWGNGTARDCIG
jgi:hypothetical protein